VPDLLRPNRAAHREAVAAEERDDRGCDDHRRAQLDKKCGPGAGSRDEADAEGERLVFGMKLYVGTDLKGRLHSLTATHAGVADITQLPALLHGEEQVLYGDQAYWKEADRQAFEAQGVR
jgi:hypothetical protein